MNSRPFRRVLRNILKKPKAKQCISTKVTCLQIFYYLDRRRKHKISEEILWNPSSSQNIKTGSFRVLFEMHCAEGLVRGLL